MIRRMTSADLMSVYGILNLNLDDYFPEDVVLFFLQQWPAGQFVATDYSGRIIGVLCGAMLDHGRASISLLAVEGSCRGSGVGSSLLENLFVACRINGLTRVQLEVRTTNRNAINFYMRRGFHITENLPMFYNDGGSGYRMVRDLSAGINPS